MRRPSTQKEFDQLFTDDTNCRLYMTALRWPCGFVCPHCHQRGRAEASTRALLRCLACGFACTPSTGTILDRSRVPLTTWLRAIWELVSRESATDLAKLQEMVPHNDARVFTDWLDAIQTVLERRWREPLRGLVEVVKVPVDVVGHSRRGRARAQHAIVGIAVEVRNRTELGNVRVCHLPRVNETTTLGFIRSAVAEGSCIRTGNWQGYARLRQHGYGHIVARNRDGSASLALAEEACSILRLWLRGRNAVEVHRLDYHLAEFTFRFNEGQCYPASDRARMFNEILNLALEVDAVALPAALRSGSG